MQALVKLTLELSGAAELRPVEARSAGTNLNDLLGDVRGMSKPQFNKILCFFTEFR